MSAPAEVHVPGAPGRCPYCHQELGGPQGLVACATCGARQHEACHREHGACSSCGGNDILVPASRQPAQLTKLAELPLGSSLTVRRTPRQLVVEWPMIPRAQRKVMILMGICLLPLVLGAFVLGWAYRYWHARVLLVLETERLRFQRPGTPMERAELDLAREEVSGVSLEAGPNLKLYHAGRDVHVIGSLGAGQVLPAPEVEWLHDLLQAWLQGRLDLDAVDARVAPPRERDDRAQPKRKGSPERAG